MAFAACGVVVVLLIASLQTAAVTIADQRAHTAALEERLHAMEELRKWHDIFHNIAVGVCLTDPRNDTVILANPAFSAMHAISPSDIAGISIFEFFVPAERQRIGGLNAEADRSGHCGYEADCLRKEDAVFHARIHNTSVKGTNGALQYRITTTQDITNERNLEEALRQAQRLEAIGHLTAGVAHDFKNVLQGVVGCLEPVEDDAYVSAATMETVSAALSFAEHGITLTNQLLSFARKQELAPHQIELDSFLNEFCNMVTRTLGSRIETKCTVEPGLGAVWADPSQLRVALLNLAVNARDAMPSGGQLRFEASAGYPEGASEGIEGVLEGLAAIRVTDSGDGIAPEHLSKVLDPFFTTKGSDGTGMGLSMVYGFAKQSGGTLSITSEQGTGTAVELWLPLASTRSVAGEPEAL
jgi:PAS domain S-box-containing protein